MGIGQQTVGELVAEDYRRAGILQQYGIDFCCGGDRTLQAACDEQEVALEEVEQALQSTDRRTTGLSMRPENWTPDFLADYIVNEHHTYVRENVPVLRNFTQKVARVHGNARPEVVEIARLFDELGAELIRHTREEEEVLFPYIKQLVAAEEGGTSRPLTQTGFDTVRDPIHMMEEDHEHAGDVMRRIRELSNDFAPPEDACNTYRAAYVKLEEFEADLHRHVHLENNILFPEAAALEAARSDH